MFCEGINNHFNWAYYVYSLKNIYIYIYSRIPLIKMLIFWKPDTSTVGQGVV